MGSSMRAPGYDLFKLVIAILLLLLFICLLLWIPTNAPGPETPTSSPPLVTTQTPRTNQTFTSSPPTDRPSLLHPGPERTPTATPPLASHTATGTSSGTLTSTPFSEHPATASVEPSPTPIFTPASTGTPVSEPTATQTVETPSNVEVCEAALSRSRLQVGGNATILRRLNFRASPGIQNNWLQTNLPGTQVAIVDGPVCLPYSIGAYVWWQIRLPDGQVGWSAESSLLGRFYFLEPSQ